MLKPPNSESVHAELLATMDNSSMSKYQSMKNRLLGTSERLAQPVFTLDKDAANDQQIPTEIEQLDSSAGSYERICEIRNQLRRSDIWIAITVYLAFVMVANLIL